MNIQELFPWDKLAHFIGGTIIAAVTVPVSLGLSVAVVATVAVVKELWDLSAEGHSSEWLDGLFGIAGGIPVWFVYLVVT